MEKKRLIIFTDIGDTIIDEGTQVFSQDGVVLRAGCIPGARETMLRLYEVGYPIAMVADGRVESFHNTMTQNGLNHIFSARAISEAVGAEKPDGRMFQRALEDMGLTEKDKRRVLMVGNNVARDMAGARRFGIRSAQLIFSDRHPTVPAHPDEEPDYVLHDPRELFALAQRLNEEL